MKRPSRGTVLIGICIIGALITASIAATSVSSAKTRLAFLKIQHQEILGMKNEFLSVRERVKEFEGRKSLSRVAGILEAVDQVLAPIGLKGRVKSLKRLDAKGTEEKAELNLKGLNMNETVNVLFSFENAPMPLVIRKVELETSFQSPEHLDMTITLSLFAAR